MIRKSYFWLLFFICFFACEEDVTSPETDFKLDNQANFSQSASTGLQFTFENPTGSNLSYAASDLEINNSMAKPPANGLPAENQLYQMFQNFQQQNTEKETTYAQQAGSQLSTLAAPPIDDPDIEPLTQTEQLLIASGFSYKSKNGSNKTYQKSRTYQMPTEDFRSISSNFDLAGVAGTNRTVTTEATVNTTTGELIGEKLLEGSNFLKRERNSQTKHFQNTIKLLNANGVLRYE